MPSKLQTYLRTKNQTVKESRCDLCLLTKFASPLTVAGFQMHSFISGRIDNEEIMRRLNVPISFSGTNKTHYKKYVSEIRNQTGASAVK